MGSIRIISGTLRGRPMQTPPGSQTRPLLSRLRKSLADILRPRLAGSKVLDLFGGSGAIAFELLSNGAARAHIVELSPETAKLILKNAAALGLGREITVTAGDGVAEIAALALKKEFFDIIVVAPPYGLGLQEKAVHALAAHPLLSPGGVVIAQRENREKAAVPAAGLVCTAARSYGRTLFEFYEIAPSGAQHT